MSKYTPCPKCGRLLNKHAPAIIKEHERMNCGIDMCKQRVKRAGRETKLRSDEKFIREVLAA